MASAIELAATRPDMTVINADGVEVPAAQALAEADAAIREAERSRLASTRWPRARFNS